MVPIDITDDDFAIEPFCDEHINVNSSSTGRNRHLHTEDHMDRDFEITGTSYPLDRGSSSSKGQSQRRRIDDGSAANPAGVGRSATSSPLNEVEKCNTCGCCCAGTGSGDDEIEMIGVGKKGRWGGLPKHVLANILGEQ
jgi:hypothetical protein